MATQVWGIDASASNMVVTSWYESNKCSICNVPDRQDFHVTMTKKNNPMMLRTACKSQLSIFVDGLEGRARVAPKWEQSKSNTA